MSGSRAAGPIEMPSPAGDVRRRAAPRRSRHVLLPFLARQHRALAVATVATVVVAAAEVLRPFPLKFVIDHLFASATAGGWSLGPPELGLLVGVTALVLAIALLEAGGAYLMDVRLMRAGERIVHDLRIAVYEHLQRLSLGFHQRRHTGDLVTRVTGDVNAVGAFFSTSLATMVTAVLTLAGMVVVGLVIDPVLAILAFATAPVIGFTAFRFRRRMRTLQRRQRETEGEIASLATEALTSIQQVRALGSEGYEHQRLERKSEERLEAGYEASIAESQFARIVDVVGAVGTAVVLVAGVFRVSQGAVSPGDLVVMVAYVRRIYRPLRTMAREWVRFSRAMVRAERVAELLSTDDVLLDRFPAIPDGALRGEVTFERVTFAYEPGRPALSNVSLRIPAGRRVALVGRSGAGKSTLAALAARFYDPASGRVLVDGRDIRDYPLSWLRSRIGLVLQDAVLFTGTVAENIAWGIEASRAQVEDAARAVGADEFIRRLPDGYDTELDPAGAGLSGGQRQRIAIARTLLRDPQLLLLDEPTSGLDVQSEGEVVAGLDVLMRGRTTVMITHSESLARRAERVVVLEAGSIVREGTPGEVLDHPTEAAGTSAASRDGRLEDAQLPNAHLLLDTTAAADLLGRSFDGGDSALKVGIRYLRYKPGTNLVVHYEVTSNGHRRDAVGMIAAGDHLARRAAKPASTALARAVGGRAGAAMPLSYEPDVDALVQWYPLDLALPALATPSAELRRQLRDIGLSVNEGSDDDPERLAYKPRRRAVLRIDGHVLKLYRRPDEFGRAATGQRAASGIRSLSTPRLEAVITDRLMTVQSFMPGSSVEDAAAAARSAGELLARLHSAPVSGLGQFDPRSQLEAAAASSRLVATIAPEHGRRLGRLLAALESRVPEGMQLVPAHGDFNARQLLVREGRLAVTDFDEFCLAPPALDQATYAAYLVRGRPSDLAGARAALDGLSRGYGRRPPGLEWYLATMILRRAARPFRYYEAGWRLRVGGMVAAAEEALDDAR